MARKEMVTRAQGGLLAAARGLLLCALSIGASLALFIAAVLSVSFILLGIGLITTPWVMDLVRVQADYRRRLAREWCGLAIPSAYRPLPKDVRPGFIGQIERTVHVLKDPASWRDIAWLLLDATAGFALALLPSSLLGQGLFGWVLAAGVWEPIVNVEGTHWYAFVPVTDQGTANLAGLTGLGMIALGLAVNTHLIRAHFIVAKLLLGVTEKQALTQRVETLAETRHEALDSSAAELRRIERDLHDGAQARLVAMGMSLGTVEALLEKDPAQARQLLAQTRQSSAETLHELRDLVRGIHPPVLAERGLGDAVRALALRMQLPVEVEVDLLVRLEDPVESAAYFAVSEMLTNAAKHSGADRVWLDVYYSEPDGKLRLLVTDNGRGGADPHGSGIQGIERRLAAFDGLLAVSSPPGGPTRISMEIPCRPVGDAPTGRPGRRNAGS
jgi:signal transduction histidine kinase